MQISAFKCVLLSLEFSGKASPIGFEERCRMSACAVVGEYIVKMLWLIKIKINYVHLSFSFSFLFS